MQPKGLQALLKADSDSVGLGGMGPETLHFCQALRWSDVASSRTATEIARDSRGVLPWQSHAICDRLSLKGSQGSPAWYSGLV